jgi:hypothetical protein
MTAPDTNPHTIFEQSKGNHGEFWKNAAVLLPFLIIYWANIAHHTMFFDEVNAWAISVASPNLSVLFHHVHFEGHPWLWYFILWIPSRLTHDPVGMKWVVAIFGTASITIFGMMSPFHRWQRALILSSYFFMWEYTVMCRMYTVMLLLAILYAVRRSRRPTGVIGCAVLMGIMASTDMTGMLLSGAFLIEYLYSTFISRELVISRKRWAAALSLYATCAALAIASLWPAKDISWQSSGKLGSYFLDGGRWLWVLGNMVAVPWWPISSLFPQHFWQENVEPLSWIYILVPFVLLAYWLTFRKQKNLLLLIGVTLFLGICFGDIVYIGRVRHWGIVFVSLILGLWLQRTSNYSIETKKLHWPLLLYGLLAMSAIAGAVAFAESWVHPFSRARETAQWLRSNEPPNVSLAGGLDVSFSSVAEELQRPVYFLECGCVDTFKLFSRDRELRAESEIPLRLVRAFADMHTQRIVFLMYRPLEPAELAQLEQTRIHPKLLTSFPGADSLYESYFVYEMKYVPPGT